MTLTPLQIIIAGVIFGHVVGKCILVRIYSKEKRPADTWPLWTLIIGVLWIVAWIIAQSSVPLSKSQTTLTIISIPNFSDLLGIISALFGSWFTYGITGFFWMFMNRGKYTSSWIKLFLTALNILSIAIGATICGVGLYTSGYSISQGTGGKSWSCGG